MDKFIEAILVVAIIALAVGGALAFSAWIFMVFWNFALPQAFGAPVLTFWQSFAITALLSIVGGYFKASSK